MQDAPKDKQLLLLLPAFDSYAKSWWIGYYSYVEKGWILKTPYTIHNKSIICADIPEPIGWLDLPPHNKPLNSDTQKVIQQAKAEICAMLEEYAKEMDTAYVKADNDLTVALSLKLSPTRIAGEVELTVGINFVESRIKHAIKVVVDAKQRPLPGFEK